MEGGDESEEEARGPTVLWEKSFQQSIIVDLSEDESLHFSDLEASLALHLNQTQPPASGTSIHLTGSAELSALDDTSSESSGEVSRSERVRESGSGPTRRSVHRPNPAQDRSPPQDTSDEEQDDLPYDGALSSPYLTQTARTDGRGPGLPGTANGTRGLKKPPSEAGAKLETSPDVPPSSPLGINQLLLRHFTQEELLQPGRLIDAETLPEVSLMESVTSTARSSMLTHNSSAAFGTNDRSENSEILWDATHNLGQEKEPVSNPSSEVQSVEDGEQAFPLVRAASFSDLKYGQGQVHYPHPDFSKVAPRVKIPKAPVGTVRPVRPSPPCTVHRDQSSPGMLDLISRVLEDSIPPPQMPPYVFTEELVPRQLQHVAELMLYPDCGGDGDDDDKRNRTKGSHLGSPAPQLPSTENFSQKHQPTSQSHMMEAEPEEKVSVSDGDRMTAELRDIVGLFGQKVDEFRASVSNMDVNTEEQQMMLRSMMEAQEQLVRRYMSRKDEHRALEMQNYMGLSRNTGTFDPDRLVEGDIFRIGMHLDDIKEMIDRNLCEQMSPPHSSSINHIFTPSPPPSLHQALCAGFSTESFKEATRTEAEEEDEDIKGHGDDEAEPHSHIITAESALKMADHLCSEERADVQRHWGNGDYDEEEEKEEEEERSSVLSAQLSRTGSESRRADWTAERQSPADLVHVAEDECDDGLSLAVELSTSCPAPKYLGDAHSQSETSLCSPCSSQRIVSPETDSGFGSSYLNQSAPGSLQPNLLTERCTSSSGTSHNDALSSSDSDGSNLQTTVHPASVGAPHWGPPTGPPTRSQLGGAAAAAAAAAAVDLWLESTTKEPSTRLQGSDRASSEPLSHCVSEPALSTNMDLEERASQANSCPCNSEALVALQSEVSRLKRDLQDGLVQLPHLTQKMDYLTCRYRQDRQERRSRSRGRTHLRPSPSVWKSSNQEQTQLSPSPTRTEDWISSDLDPSRSKGTDSDGAGSDIMLQFHTSPAGSRRGSRVRSGAAELQHKAHGTQQARREGNGPMKSSSLGSVIKNGVCERPAEKRPTSAVDSLFPSERWSPLSSLPPRRPLLQVSYGSSSSLPASYKVREPPQSWSHHRKRSTQSDTALLPSNVFFQRTLSPPVSVSPVSPLSSKAVSRTSRRRVRNKEDEISRTLDQAIEVALGMKRTTERMAKRLSADLAKAQRHTRLYNKPPLGGSKHQAS